MTIKTATRIAIAGVGLALALFVAAPFVASFVAPETLTHQQAARNWMFYRIAEAILAGGGVLTFLAVLASKQKDKS